MASENVDCHNDTPDPARPAAGGRHTKLETCRGAYHNLLGDYTKQRDQRDALAAELAAARDSIARLREAVDLVLDDETGDLDFVRYQVKRTLDSDDLADPAPDGSPAPGGEDG